VAYTDNIIPTMTGFTAPSGVASGSSQYNTTTRSYWRAFNHANAVADDSWITAGGATTGYIQYQFSAAHVITRYAVTSDNEAAPNVRAPKTWTFKGSNDGAAWTTLDTQTNITDWATSPNTRKVFDLANSTAYAYYRLDITESNTATYLGVGELEMMETAAAPPPGGTVPLGLLRTQFFPPRGVIING